MDVFGSLKAKCKFHQHFMSSFFVRKLDNFILEVKPYIFLAQEIGGKAALKMLVKLTTGVALHYLIE
jgi:hypothetical protein